MPSTRARIVGYTKLNNLWRFLKKLNILMSKSIEVEEDWSKFMKRHIPPSKRGGPKNGAN